jgi:cytochrome c
MSRGCDRSRLFAVLAVLSLATASHAETAALTDAEAKKLFNQRSCNACHAVDETRLGPAYRTVGLRYRSAPPDAADWLATKIISGGAGSWGNVPMISNPSVSPEEARAIARWILDLGRAKEPMKAR